MKNEILPVREQLWNRPVEAEQPDPVPIEIPADGMPESESLEEMMSRLVRTEVSRYREASQDDPEGLIEQLDDDEDGEREMLSGYEVVQMEGEGPALTMEEISDHGDLLALERTFKEKYGITDDEDNIAVNSDTEQEQQRAPVEEESQ